MDAQLHNKDEGDCSVCMHHGLFGENDAFKTKKTSNFVKVRNLPGGQAEVPLRARQVEWGGSRGGVGCPRPAAGVPGLRHARPFRT
jgi:hypothetical protein